MKPEDAIALFLGAGKRPWTDFETAPVKASRQLHVNANDIARGRMIDEWAAEQTRVKAVSDHLEAQKRRPLVPYGQTMKPETSPPSDAPSATAWDGPQQWKGPTLPEAMTGGVLMGGLGMMGGALGRAAWKPLLALDIGNAAHAVTSKLTGHDENIVPPSEFKYGMRLPETLLGYGDSPEAGVGELMGFFSGVSPLRALERPIAAGIRSMKPRVPESNRLEYWKDVPQFAGGGVVGNFKFMTPERLQRLVNEFGYVAGTPRSKGALGSISAINFLKGTTTSEQNLARIYSEAGNFRPEDFQQEHQYPFLLTRPDAREITGHEGRHRIAAALKKNEGRDFDLPIVLRDSEASNWDAWKNVRGMLGGQDFGSIGRGSPVLVGGTEPIDYGNEEQLRRFLIPDARQNFADGGLAKAAQWALPALTKAWAPSVVKPKGGQWLTGSVENALRGLKIGSTADAVNAVRNIRPELSEAEALAFINSPLPEEGRTAINNWVEGPLTKYVKTRMASPEDEVRRLADEGTLHSTPGVGNEMLGRKARSEAGMPIENTATTDLGRSWENATDLLVNPNTFRFAVPAGINYNAPNAKELQNGALRKLGGEYAVQNPDAKIYGINRNTAIGLGFDHLVDELKNALDPNSGLPRHLMLTPDAVKNMSMEKAVRRVADINAWRAVQQAEANQQIAGGPGQALVREYPHSDTVPNPKGLRWVELKKSEALPEGWSFKPGEGEYEGHDWYFDPEGKAHNALSDPRHADLEKQLRYEGDTMGHCVGGYCDDVISGNSRIFSLRDAKGEPHVTVEVEPNNIRGGVSGNRVDAIRPGTWYEYLAQQQDAENGIDGLLNYITAKHPEVVEKLKQPSIVQIKGKQNRKPNDEYLPFVQDFVKNPPIKDVKQWGDVGDLNNTGLIDMGKYTGNFIQGLMSKDEAVAAVRSLQASGEHPAPSLQNWIDDLSKNFNPREYAQGGSVHAPDVVKQFLSVQL